jgi:hypothetical protein
MKWIMVLLALNLPTLGVPETSEFEMTQAFSEQRFNVSQVSDPVLCAILTLKERRGQPITAEDRLNARDCPSQQQISFHEFLEVEDPAITRLRYGMAVGIKRYLDHKDEGCRLETINLRPRVEEAVSERHSYAELVARDTWGAAWDKYTRALFDLIICD